ncbi:Flp pilus assembly protein CpaB [Kineococcus sp. R8]|nr:Flp pilus assembly protein CpaB [Kineococcus siccus]
MLRRWLAAGLTAAAGGLAVATLAPPAPRTAALLVAARDLPAGAALLAADVRVVRWPADQRPDGAVPALPAGAVLGSPLRRGEPVTDARTAGPGVLAGQPPGTLAALVDVGSPAGLTGLAPGARVDVLARTDDPVTGAATGAERLAADVVVLAVPTAAGADGLLGAAAPTATSVLVAVDAATAAALTAAAGRTVVVLRAPR